MVQVDRHRLQGGTTSAQSELSSFYLNGVLCRLSPIPPSRQERVLGSRHGG